MLRKRIITVLTFLDGVLFRTKFFNPDYRYTHEFIDAWMVDEIILLDITRGKRNVEKFQEIVRTFSQKCFVPLSVGGGVRTLEDVHQLMRRGADKVVVNTGAFDDPKLISSIANAYGSQAVVLSIDAKIQVDGSFKVMSHLGTNDTGLEPKEWARKGAELGAGEILVTSIDKDGSLEGYDLVLIKSVVDSVAVPVIVLGGAGNWAHMADVITVTGVSGVCTQNIYHFTNESLKSAKTFLKSKLIEVRNTSGESSDYVL